MDRYQLSKQDLHIEYWRELLEDQLHPYIGAQFNMQYNWYAIHNTAINLVKLYACFPDTERMNDYSEHALRFLGFEAMKQDKKTKQRPQGGNLQSISEIPYFLKYYMDLFILTKNKKKFDEYFLKWKDATTILPIKNFAIHSYELAYLDDAHIAGHLAKMKIPKKFLSIWGPFRDAVVDCIKMDESRFVDDIITFCEAYRKNIVHGSPYLYRFYSDSAVELVMIMNFKGIEVQVPHDAIPELYGGLGDIEKYPRITANDLATNEYIFSENSGNFPSKHFRIYGTYVEKGDVEKKLNLFGPQLAASGHLEYYYDDHEIFTNICIRIFKKGTYIFDIWSEDIQLKSKGEIHYKLKLTCEKSGNIIDTNVLKISSD